MKILDVKKIKGYNLINKVVYRLEIIVFKIDRNLEMMCKEIWGQRGGTLYCYLNLKGLPVRLQFLNMLLFIHTYLIFLVALTGLSIPTPGLLLTE